MAGKLCVAVVSPFLDKRHGTERCVLEQVKRLAGEHGYQIHLYCQRVEDIARLGTFGSEAKSIGQGTEPSGSAGVAPSGRILWHRVSDIPGPHLMKYLWWFFANRLRRWRDQRFGLLRHDLVYSPGINCLDADVIVVHIVFHEFHRLVRDELRLANVPLRIWPRALHRRLYYRLIMALEKRIYSNPRVALAAVSGLTAGELLRFFGRSDVQVIPNAIDLHTFNPEIRLTRRAEARRHLQYNEEDFVLLLIGNDWKKKGLGALLEAVARCKDLPFRVLVVGRDERVPYDETIQRVGLEGRVQFADPSADVVRFYAAADAYAGPSLLDDFGLPPAEAMACGLPVITSAKSGVSEMVADGRDGFVLRDPKDAAELARILRVVYEHPELRRKVGETAAVTAQQFRWERNVQQTKELLERAWNRKNS